MSVCEWISRSRFQPYGIPEFTKPLGVTRPVDEGKKLTGRCDLNDRHFIKTRGYTLSAINVPRT